jgi:hypothetical protein
MNTMNLTLSRTEVEIRRDPDGQYRVKRVYGKPGDQIKWKCPNCNIFIIFPAKRTPFAGGETEASGKSPVSGTIDGKANGFFIYSAMVQDQHGDLHVVEGNSPPEMVIE